jgi:DHA1 family bicyclomycin/chloramphenicol resistance-like MFS transporter
LFAYLGGAPIVFINHFNISPARFAMVFGIVSLCFITASQINPRLIRRFGFDTVLTSSTWAYVTLVGLLLILAIDGTGGVVLFAGVLALSHGMNGFLAPCATVSALRHHADHAGSASALLGTLQFGLGATGGMLVGWLTNGTAVPMAGLMFCGAVAMKIADLCRPREAN